MSKCAERATLAQGVAGVGAATTSCSRKRATLSLSDLQEPTAAALVCEYILTLWANMAAAASLYCACTAQAAAAQAACLTAAWWLTVAAWAQGRSRGGALLGALPRIECRKRGLCSLLRTALWAGLHCTVHAGKALCAPQTVVNHNKLQATSCCRRRHVV